MLADLPAHYASPMIVGGRLAFISDHEGWYARQASTDGQRIISLLGRLGYLHVPDMVSQGWADFRPSRRRPPLPPRAQT